MFGKRDDSLYELQNNMAFASAEKVKEYEQLGVDFMQKILNLDFHECFISDESTLYDFLNGACDQLDQKILDIYRVDVSDVEDRNLVQIFEKISKSVNQ